MTIRTRLWTLALGLALFPPAVFSQQLDGLVETVGAQLPEETFSLNEHALEALATAAISDSIAIRDFPTEVGVRRPVHLERVDVYARNAKIFLVEGDQTRELPRSDRLFFRGYATDASGARAKTF